MDKVKKALHKANDAVKAEAAKVGCKLEEARRETERLAEQTQREAEKAKQAAKEVARQAAEEAKHTAEQAEREAEKMKQAAKEAARRTAEDADRETAKIAVEAKRANEKIMAIKTPEDFDAAARSAFDCKFFNKPSTAKPTFENNSDFNAYLKDEKDDSVACVPPGGKYYLRYDGVACYEVIGSDKVMKVTGDPKYDSVSTPCSSFLTNKSLEVTCTNGEKNIINSLKDATGTLIQDFSGGVKTRSEMIEQGKHFDWLKLFDMSTIPTTSASQSNTSASSHGKGGADHRDPKVTYVGDINIDKSPTTRLA